MKWIEVSDKLASQLDFYKNEGDRDAVKSELCDLFQWIARSMDGEGLPVDRGCRLLGVICAFVEFVNACENGVKNSDAMDNIPEAYR